MGAFVIIGGAAAALAGWVLWRRRMASPMSSRKDVQEVSAVAEKAPVSRATESAKKSRRGATDDELELALGWP